MHTAAAAALTPLAPGSMHCCSCPWLARPVQATAHVSRSYLRNPPWACPWSSCRHTCCGVALHMSQVGMMQVVGLSVSITPLVGPVYICLDCPCAAWLFQAVQSVHGCMHGMLQVLRAQCPIGCCCCCHCDQTYGSMPNGFESFTHVGVLPAAACFQCVQEITLLSADGLQ